MEGSQQLVEIVKQGVQQIMPVPIPESGISDVPEYIQPHGDLMHAVYKPNEHNRKNDNMQYCNFIPPAPRDPLVNVPYLGPSCPYNPDSKNKPEGCFLVKNHVQGTTGFVCKDAGGTKNANFVRGNQFGVDYDMDVDGLSKSKKVEYTIENPVQLPIQMRNPLVKYDKSTFYPTYLQSYNSLDTYPHASNYDTYADEGNIAKGIPTYKYPYKVINPMKNQKDVISLRDNETYLNQNDKNNGVVQEGDATIELNQVEKFSGLNIDTKYMSVSQKYASVIIIFTILILILILMFIFCKKIEVGCLLKEFSKFVKKMM